MIAFFCPGKSEGKQNSEDNCEGSENSAQEMAKEQGVPKEIGEAPVCIV